MDRTIDRLTELVRTFRDEREWAPFHNPKDLAVSVAIEAGELLELFQWKGPDEVREHLATDAGRTAMADEMADILILLLSAADATGIDLHEATVAKIAKNAEKYPVDKARGNAKKYDRL